MSLFGCLIISLGYLTYRAQIYVDSPLHYRKKCVCVCLFKYLQSLTGALSRTYILGESCDLMPVDSPCTEKHLKTPEIPECPDSKATRGARTQSHTWHSVHLFSGNNAAYFYCCGIHCACFVERRFPDILLFCCVESDLSVKVSEKWNNPVTKQNKTILYEMLGSSVFSVSFSARLFIHFDIFDLFVHLRFNLTSESPLAEDRNTTRAWKS